MIDRTKPFWTGDCAEDIGEYLRAYTEDEHLETVPVLCHSCGKDAFLVYIDRNEDVIQVECACCGTKKYLLDSEEYSDHAEPHLLKCPICGGGRKFQVRAGFQRREDGSLRWVYIGNRCMDCKTLGSCRDWKINYEPTDQMEQNL